MTHIFSKYVFPRHKYVIQNTIHMAFQTTSYLCSTDSSDHMWKPFREKVKSNLVNKFWRPLD